MGTSGVPWKASKEAIITAIRNRHGRLTYAAKDLGVHYHTLKRRVDADPNLVKLVDELRNEFDTTLLDSAEDYLLRALNQWEDLGNGLKATFFVLNNKGKLRGYFPPRSQEIDAKETEAHEIVRAIREINQSSGAERPQQSNLETEQSILHQRPVRQEDSIQTKLGTEDTSI